MAKNNLNISLGVDVDNLKKGFEDAIRVTQAAGKKTEQEARLMAEGIVRQLDKIGNQSTMRGAIRQMENLAGQMQRVGLEGTKAFNEVIKQTGRLKDEQQDLKALIQTGGPAGAFIAMGNAAKVAMGGVNALQGAMTLMGAEGEDLQRTMVKLQAGMAFAQGLKELEGLKDTMTQLNMVVKANPMIAWTAGVLALAAAFAALAASLTDVSDTQKVINEISNKSVASNLNEITTLRQLQNVINSEVATRDEKNNAVKRAIDIAPQYLGYLKNEGITQEKINNAITEYIDLLGLQGRAEAAKSLYVDSLKKQLEIENKIQQAGGRKAIELAAARVGAVAPIIAELNKQTELTKQYEKQFNLIQRTAQVEEDRLKTRNKASAFTATQTTTTSKDQYVSPFPNKPKNVDISAKGIFNPVGFGDMQKAFDVAGYSAEELRKKYEELHSVSIDLSKSLSQSVSSSLVDVASAMGTAMASGQDFGKAIGTVMLQALANFMRQLGEMFIAAGVAKLGFDKAMISIGGAPLAIAAGAALVAASAAATAKIQQANQPARFANGGYMVGGNSFTGDRVPALLNSGEMVLNKQQQANLFAIANGQKNASSKTGYIAETRISGRDLQILLKHAGNDTYRGG